MDNQKLENLLNLALDVPDEVRERSSELGVGYEREEKSWELIVKYNGSLEHLAEYGVTVEELLFGYAVLTVPESRIEAVAASEQIEYVEKPKRLFFETARGKEVSCVQPVTLREPYLDGAGVILAVIDSGIDYANRHFRNEDGATRILALWDQTVSPDEERGFYPPEGFALGTEFSREQINEALGRQSSVERFAAVPSRDASGHGTAVAGIAAGSAVFAGADLLENVLPGNVYEGVAPKSDFLIVKLGVPRRDSFPRTTELMRAVAYAVRKARDLNRPLVINLSFGNTYGPHDGTSLLERFLDNASEVGRTVICVGSGNEGASAGHAQGRTGEKLPGAAAVELAVANYETSLGVQLWKDYTDEYRVTLRSPGGQICELPRNGTGKFVSRLEQTDILVYMGKPAPYTVAQEIYFDFLPVETYLTAGVWMFTLEAVGEPLGQYRFYLPGAGVINGGTKFFSPSPQNTLTIPSTAARCVTVAAYDSSYQSYADFSGRGYVYGKPGELAAGMVKPDLAAPGVDIVAPDTFGGYGAFTGTSFATPFVSGAAALLMQWGIVKGNDPFLYGEKLKAYLRAGAKPLRGETRYPNERVGFGALCVKDSLPKSR